MLLAVARVVFRKYLCNSDPYENAAGEVFAFSLVTVAVSGVN